MKIIVHDTISSTRRLLNHNVRYRNVRWDPAAVTIGEHAVSEGLAESFVREIHGEQAKGPWSTRLTTASGLSAAQSTALPLEEILANAGVTVRKS